MSYPTRYERQYDFQGYQNANPTRPLPADRVNADLNAVETSIDEIVDFIEGIARADGHLANGSVGLDQLDTDVLQLLERLVNGQDIDSFTVSINPLASVEALRNLDASYRNRFAYVASYYEGLGKGGGWFYYDEEDHGSSDDSFLTFVDDADRRWKRLFNGEVANAYMAGCYFDYEEGSTTYHNDTVAFQRAVNISASERLWVELPPAKAAIGIPGSSSPRAITIPSGIPSAPGPLIRGSGYDTVLVRTPGYGNPAGGGGKWMFQTTGLSVTEDMYLGNFRMGTLDPDAGDYGGHGMSIRMKRSTIEKLTGANIVGIFINSQCDDSVIQHIKRYADSVDLVEGAAIRINGGRNVLVKDMPYVTSADDCVQLNVANGYQNFSDNGDVLAPEDTTDDYWRTATNIRFENIGAYATQGMGVGVLVGSRNTSVRSTSVQNIKTQVGTNLIQINSKRANPVLGQEVDIRDCVNGGGLLAAQINGTREVVSIDDESTFYVEADGTASSTAFVHDGGNATVQMLKVTTTNGSDEVMVRIQAHELDVGGKFRIFNWDNEGGLTQDDIPETCEVSEVVDADHVKFVALAAASADYNDFPDSLGVALMARGGAQDITWKNIRGTGGDRSITDFGGIAGKFLNTEGSVEARTTLEDVTITSTETMDACHTRIRAVTAAMKIFATRHRMLAPRNITLFCEAVEDVTCRIPIFEGSGYFGKDCYVDAPSMDEAPSIVFDGGRLILEGGTVKVRPDAPYGMIFASAYEFAELNKSSRTVADPTGFAMEEIVFRGVRFEGVGEGMTLMQLGNVERLVMDGCTVKPNVEGSTNWKVAEMLAASGDDPGTSNARFINNDFGGNEDPFDNWQDGVGNYWDDDPAIDAMHFKGVIDCSANPNYPGADAGDTYRVSAAGKIGGASGPNVEVGDLLICIADDTAAGTHAARGASWSIEQANIDGAVTGPASSVSGNFATFNGTSGKIIQDSGLALSTDGAFTGNSDVLVPSQKAAKTYADLKLAKASNLSDVANAATARTNLGLGSGDSPTFTGLTVSGHSGTWTPVLTFGTPGNLAVTYSTQLGFWYREANGLIKCYFNLSTSAFTHTTAAGSMQITGLPFTVGTALGGSGIEWQGITKANYTQIVPRPTAAGTLLTLIASGSGQSVSAITTADAPTGGSVVLRGWCHFVL